VDANSCYSADQAIEIGKLLEDNDVSHFEEPCPYWEPEQTKKVTDALSIDVTGGEQDCDLRIWRDMVDRKIVNIFQPDVMYLGGLLKAIPNAGPYLELSIEGQDYYPWQQELFLDKPFEVKNGSVNISDKPGWGVEINPHWIETAAYEVSEAN